MERDYSYSFRGQRPNERILLIAKQHVWLFFSVMIIWLVLLVVTLLAFRFFGASGISSIALTVAIVFGLLYSGYRWFLWANGMYIVTNERVIKTEQAGIFKRLISEAELDRIQEITTEITGPIHTMLNFGVVHIQTASRSGRIDLTDIPLPYDIQQTIVRARRQAAPSAEIAETLSTDG